MMDAQMRFIKLCRRFESLHKRIIHSVHCASKCVHPSSFFFCVCVSAFVNRCSNVILAFVLSLVFPASDTCSSFTDSKYFMFKRDRIRGRKISLKHKVTHTHTFCLQCLRTFACLSIESRTKIVSKLTKFFSIFSHFLIFQCVAVIRPLKIYIFQ